MKPFMKTMGLILTGVFFSMNVSAASSVRVYTARDSLTGPRLQFSAECPRVEGIRNSAAQNRINIRLKETADSARQAALLASKTGAGGVRGRFTFAVPRNAGGFASVVMKREIAAGAEKEIRQTSLTFDTVDGRELRLCDLFRDGVDSRSMLNDAVDRQIAARSLKPRQTRPYASLGENRQFYLTSDSLVLYLEPGQCFPASDGVVEFKLSLRSMDACLKPAFLL